MKKLLLESKADQKYWEQLWQKNEFKKAIKYIPYTQQYKIVKKYINKEEPILEGGSGLSQWVYLLQQEQYDIKGIDFAEETVNRLKQSFPSLQVEKGNILHLEYPENSFGTYLSWGVMEHFEEGPDQALKEAYRILKPGGYLIVTVPFLSLLRKRLYKESETIGNGFFFQYIFTKKEFRTWLEKNNFIVEQIKTQNWILGAKEYLEYKKRGVISEESYEFNSSQHGDEAENKQTWYLMHILKEKLKQMIFKINDCQFMTNLCGHMVLFVAKKPETEEG